MRKPKVSNSQPEWIQRAAEKRKRASLLIEQGAWLEFVLFYVKELVSVQKSRKHNLFRVACDALSAHNS